MMFDMKQTTLKVMGSALVGFTLFGLSASVHAAEPTRAVLLTPIQGSFSKTAPADVKLLVTEGQAKGCIIQGTAYLNKKRLRYEYQLAPVNCIKNGQKIDVGQVVRGQHNIKGTMANSGMGRDYLSSNKGVTVTLADY